MTLEADEFIRRFLLHVLPPGFMRLRHYGLLSNRDRAQKLSKCRELLQQTESIALQPQQFPDWKSRYEELTGVSFDTCPSCRLRHMVCIEILVSSVRKPARRRTQPRIDSS